MFAVLTLFLVLAPAASGTQAQGKPPAPPPPAPVLFNLTHGSYMVLQQAPAKASVFGTVPPEATMVTITVADTSAASASYTVTAKPAGGLWKAFLQPSQAGGDYSVTAVCTGCVNKTVAKLEHVTFGDVWYCAGQSNMWLPMSYSYHRNFSISNITAGNYDNIRLMAGNSQAGTFHPWMTAKQAAADAPSTGKGTHATTPAPYLFQFSAACWYFAQTLTEELKARQTGQLESGASVVPLGLISTAIGGSMIEEWMPNATRTAACTETSDGQHDQTLWDQKVVPYLDMTVKGFLWYQGENNMHGVKGSYSKSTGYACQMPTMIKKWREEWSTVDGTTDPEAPFGLVVLPGSGGEGGANMGAMRIAQTASYGTLPNAAMPNTFLAQAYDLNDPWGDKTCYGLSCCWNRYNESACTASLAKKGFPATACNHYCDILKGTNVYMGGIHPRIKLPVGQRLAKAALAQVYGGTGPTSGATISGCAYTEGAKAMTIKFNKTLLATDTVFVQPINTTLTPMQVLTNASDFCLEPQMLCDVVYKNGSRANPCPRGNMTWQCPDGDLATALGGHGPANPYDAAWQNAPLVKGTAPGTVQLDLSSISGTVVAIRYGIGPSSCCQGNGINVPCSIEQCPIMSSPSGLPANPFVARVAGGKCTCIPPQVCDE